MVARIHYTEAGVEYVLQFNSRTDTVELHQNKHTLIGGIPNYFQDTGGVLVTEIKAFKEHLLNGRPCLRFTPLPEYLPEFAHEEMTSLPQLTDAEIEAIDTFEDIVEVYLCLTPNSVVKHRKLRDNSALLAIRQLTRQLRGLDINPLIQAANSMVDGLNTASEVASQQVAELARELRDHVENREGLTDEQVQENLMFVARLMQGESISATESTPPETHTPTDVNDAALNRLLNEIEEAIEDDERVRGAPTHPIYLSDTTVSSLSREADDEDDTGTQ